MTKLKQAIDLLGKLVANEAVDAATLQRVGADLADTLAALGDPNAKLEQLTLSQTGHGQSKAEQKPPKPFRIDRDTPAAETHIAALTASDTDQERFEAALIRLLEDRSVTVKLLRTIASAYGGTPVSSRMTRSDAERSIRQTFARRQWQAEAYRRIDSLNASR